MERLDRRDGRTGTARRLRHEATPAEKALWQQLRLIVLHGHFRRQAPLGPYFADFAHLALKLVVELDGDQHGHEAGLRHDAVRTAFLEQAGFRVLRFWNHEVRDNLDGVTETILAALSERASLVSAPTCPKAEARA
jgi:very-short-patch-repair endonuclease